MVWFVSCEGLRRLIVLHVVVLVCTVDVTKEERERVEEEEEEEGCDPLFRRNVENCLQSLQGFHVMTRHKTLILGDWGRTDFICMFQLMQMVGVCLSSVYALSPLARRWRSLCGFQSLDPDLLTLYGQAVCRNRQVLKEHWECLNDSQGVLENCLYEFHARIPSRLTTGMWKEPLYSPHCSYHAYAEHCFEKHMFGRCSIDLYYAHLDILKATCPPTCSWQDVDLLKRRFRATESYIVYYGSSERPPRSLTNCVIAALLVSLVTVDVLGVG